MNVFLELQEIELKMKRSSPYPFQTFKNQLTKKQKQHLEINDLIVKIFGSIEGYTNAEDVWLMMKSKGVELSISSFYNRLKQLVEENVIEKKPNGYNKFIYKVNTIRT